MSTPYRIYVSVDRTEREALNVPISAGQTGGFQGLLRELQQALKKNPEGLSLDRETAERLVRYFSRYGKGGWQGRLASVVEKVRAELHAHPLPTLDL